MFKLIFSFFCLIFTIEPSFAQKIVVHPKKGEINFSSKTTIKDQELFDEAINGKRDRLVESLMASFSALNDSTIIDLSLLNKVKSEMKAQPFKIEDFDYHQIYLDTLIKTYVTNSDTLVGDFILINSKESTFITQAKNNNPQTFAYSKNKDVTIEEFRKERKVINGFDCFKVIYTYKIDFSDEEIDEVDILNFLGTDQTNITTYWVTEKIQSLYHPICKEKEILAKYYPLEIIQETAFFKGMIVSYLLKSISLSN